MSIPESRLHATFTDASDTDYDKLVETTRKKMKNSDPTTSLREISVAISMLKNLRTEYRIRPCFEGYCFGVVTPHRSRIDRRIQALEAEKTTFHESNSQAFERDKERIVERQHEMDILEKKIDAAKDYTETERNEKKKKGFKF